MKTKAKTFTRSKTAGDAVADYMINEQPPLAMLYAIHKFCERLEKECAIWCQTNPNNAKAMRRLRGDIKNIIAFWE